MAKDPWRPKHVAKNMFVHAGYVLQIKTISKRDVKKHSHPSVYLTATIGSTLLRSETVVTLVHCCALVYFQ